MNGRPREHALIGFRLSDHGTPGASAIDTYRTLRRPCACLDTARRRLFRTASCLSALLLGQILCAAAAAESSGEPQRQGYSLLGVGFNFVDYEESTAPSFDGSTVDIETDLSLIPTHDSRVFVAIDDAWGFYLSGNSSLGVPVADESWEIGEIPVRTNRVSFEQQRLTLLAARRFRRSGNWLFGARYSKTEFNRFSSELTPAAADFGIDNTSFSLGTVSENVWDISALIGYESTTLFVGRESGWRHQLRLIVGLPLLTTISNTEVDDGERFRSGFGGYQLGAIGTYGYQFGEHLLAAASFELSLARRDAIDRESRDEFGVTSFPANNLVYVFPSLGVFWSF